MKKSYLTVLVAALLAIVSVAQAQQTTDNSFGGTVVGSQQETAKVKKINRKTREITLKTPDGNKTTVVAGPEIRNFDQIKKGDTVNATYTEAVTVVVTGAGAAVPPKSQQTTEVERAPQGAQPRGSITRTTRSYGVVKDINYPDRTATLQGPDNTITVKVGPEAVNFDRVKIGDNVEITHMQKFALAVTK